MDISTINFDLSQLDPALLELIPAHLPPEGVTPNFVDPESRAHIVSIVTYLTLPLMLVFVALRIFTRIYISRTLGADDVLCVIAAMSVTGFCGVVLSMLGNPIGPHQWNVPVSKIDIPFLEKSLASVCMYILSAMWVKTTLLVFYLRLFQPSARARVAIWAGIGACVAFYVVCMALNLAQCVPVSQSLLTAGSEGQLACARAQLDLSAAQGVFSAATDFYVLVVPVSLVLRLRLPRRRKVGVSAIFSTGLLACICSVLSAVYRIRQFDSADYTWDSIGPFALGAAELNVGLICGCIPVVFVLFKKATKTGAWVAVRQYLSTQRAAWAARKHRHLHHLGSSDPAMTTTTTTTSSGAEPWGVKTPAAVHDMQGGGGGGGRRELPKIPRATITGLRSFVLGAYRTQVTTTATTATATATATTTTQVQTHSENESETTVAPGTAVSTDDDGPGFGENGKNGSDSSYPVTGGLHQGYHAV